MNSYKTLLFSILTCVILGSTSGCQEAKNSAESANEEVITAVSQTEDLANAEEVSTEESKDRNAKVKISTDLGDMIAILYDETPLHRDNFIKLTEEGFFNDLLFHRVIDGFMIQGGDPDSRGAAPTDRLGRGGPGYTLPAEIKPEFVHIKGALSAARRGGPSNPEKRSSGSQFYVVQGKPVTLDMLMGMEKRLNMGKDSAEHFHYTDEQIEAYLNLGGTPHLDGEYTVFGKVIDGLDVLDKIASVPTARGDRPLEDVKMTIELINK